MPEANRNAATSDRLTTVLSYGVLVLLGYLVFRITEPFLVPLAWSAVFAIFFYPLYEALAKRFSSSKAALLCTLAVTLLLIVPVLLVLTYAAREAIVASARIQSAISNGDSGLPAEIVQSLHNRLPQSLSDVDFMGPLRQGAEKIAAYLTSSLGALVKNLFSFFVSLFILLFALFFMFRDGESIVAALRHLIPFEPEIQEEMLSESRELIFASVAIALLIAAIQGALGGLAFQLTGLVAPVFMGVLIAFFSIVPVCGGVAGIADNIIRPLLLRNRTKLNDLLLFISILGGLEAFGLLGLVFGPTIVAAALAVFRVYTEHSDEIDSPAQPTA